jgi:hypothetical protein
MRLTRSGALKASRSRLSTWFTGAFDPRDLKEGKALLEELQAR